MRVTAPVSFLTLFDKIDNIFHAFEVGDLINIKNETETFLDFGDDCHVLQGVPLSHIPKHPSQIDYILRYAQNTGDDGDHKPLNPRSIVILVWHVCYPKSGAIG